MAGHRHNCSHDLARQAGRVDRNYLLHQLERLNGKYPAARQTRWWLRTVGARTQFRADENEGSRAETEGNFASKQAGLNPAKDGFISVSMHFYLFPSRCSYSHAERSVQCPLFMFCINLECANPRLGHKSVLRPDRSSPMRFFLRAVPWHTHKQGCTACVRVKRPEQKPHGTATYLHTFPQFVLLPSQSKGDEEAEALLSYQLGILARMYLRIYRLRKVRC